MDSWDLIFGYLELGVQSEDVFSRSVVSDSFATPCKSPSGSSVHGILQAGILEWVAISYTRDLPDPGNYESFLYAFSHLIL